MAVDLNLPADGVRKVFRSLPRLHTRIHGTHVARVEDAVCELARVCGRVVRVLGLTRDAARVGDDMLI